MSNRAGVHREPLSRERVLAAAMALADAGGVDAITMRRLGQELGVEAMSLYNHVANKDEVLDGILDAVLAEFELAPVDADWREGVRGTAVSANAVLLRHHWAVGLWHSRRAVGEAQKQYMESILGCLRRGGFTASQTHHAYHVIDGHVFGYTMRQVNFPMPSGDLEQMAREFLESLSTSEYPYLHEHVIGHIDGTFEGGGGFAFALDLILDGLEKFREAG
jgi:AcrR family transcriptional regulator